MLDCEKTTTIAVTIQDKEKSLTLVTEHKMKDVFHKLVSYYAETHGKPTWELMGEDYIDYFKGIMRLVIKEEDEKRKARK